MENRTIIFVLSLSLALFGVKFGFNYYNTEKREEWIKKHGVPDNIPSHSLTATAPKQALSPTDSTAITAYRDTASQETAPHAPATFYVLENEYQQLVFSDQGAALVEINLPFQTQQNKNSVVLPIEFDRDILAQSPANAYFPIHKAKSANGKEKKQILGGYYPLLRREQIINNKRVEMPARYYGLNIISDYPEVAELHYEVKKFTATEIVFEARQSHRRITKRFTLLDNPNDAPYCFNLEIKIEGDSRGLWLTSGIPDIEWISGSSGSVIKYHIFRGKTSVVEKIDLPKEAFTLASVSPDWVCNSNGFFGMIIDALHGVDAGFRAEHISGATAPSRLHLVDLTYDRFPIKELPGYQLQIPLKSNLQTMKFRLFAGPFDDVILNKIDSFYASEQGGQESDYIACQTFHGWFAFISEPFAKFLFFLMKFFHSLFGSWALAIFLITCVLRVLLYPLNTWSLRSMKRMQQIAPELKAIQERNKKEPQKAQQEIMALYRENSVNPVSGCLPLIIQMPFLIGMFDLLKSAFQLRGASFIPGWINDLSAPDVLFSWGYPLPLIGNEFHLLPFVLGGIMFVQQNLMSTLPKDPSLLTDQQRQQKAMGNVMTIVLTVMFYQFPSGLNIYWISSMLLSMAQQWWTNRDMDQKVTVLPALQKSLHHGKKRH